ncbi:MAG: hypothetical protein J0I20_03135 [Chloroflexi bacterium]|nr:hypothetical protein [Chloroflexota bacterium]OJV89248.1 MAG: hypothetical protein BGO39_35210 [Chloroflexi bacterium 54-19]
MDNATLDLETRRAILDHLRTTGELPGADQVAQALQLSNPEIEASFRRLHDGHIIVLQENGRDILMVQPFSAVPTPFNVEVAGRTWWGNCIWDAMGIVALFKQDAVIRTACADCNDSMLLTFENNALASGEGVIHFEVPARHWWDNIRFT